MAVGFPTLLFAAAPRAAIARIQQQLATAQKELSAQRLADPGLALGADVSRLAGLHWQATELEGQQGRIAMARNRAEATQGSLEAIADLAGRVLGTAAAARGSAQGQRVIADAARESLSGLISLINASHGGSYLFGGLNGETPPLADFAGSPGEEAISDAFVTTFGFEPSDPAAATLTAAEISAFLDGPFATLFDETGWQDIWVSSTPETPVTTLGEGQRIGAAVSASAPFAAKLTQALTMMLTLADGRLMQEALVVVLDKAMSLIAEAQSDLVAEQGRIGLAQQSLREASETAEARLGRTRLAIEILQGVDAYALATEINMLTTQLQASYTLTSRLGQMSLLSYI